MESIPVKMETRDNYRRRTKNHNATFGWKIILPDRTILFQGAAGPADGPQESESSTRSEHFGLTAPMLVIVQLEKWWGLKH
jgi:hypothetical protein